MWEASPRPGDLLHWPGVYFPPLNLGPGPEGRGGYPRSWLQACPPLQGPDESPLTLEASFPQRWLPNLLQEWAVLPWVRPGGLASLQRAVLSCVLGQGVRGPTKWPQGPWAAELCSGVKFFTLPTDLSFWGGFVLESMLKFHRVSPRSKVPTYVGTFCDEGDRP